MPSIINGRVELDRLTFADAMRFRTHLDPLHSRPRDVLAFTDWGYTIKEYNQSLRSSSQAFFLLENPAGTFVPRQ